MSTPNAIERRVEISRDLSRPESQSVLTSIAPRNTRQAATDSMSSAHCLQMQQRAALCSSVHILRSARLRSLLPHLAVCGGRDVSCSCTSTTALRDICSQAKGRQAGAVYCHNIDNGTSQPPEALHEIQARLWDRQENFLNREIKRWDQERRQWDKREEAMQQRIRTLEVTTHARLPVLAS